MFFAPLLVYNMFSYLNDRRGSDFFHSLPQKRICVYISFMSAILTWIVSVLCVTSIVNTLLWAMADGYILSLKAVMLTLLGFLILALVMMGFMALSMTLTGTAVANCLVFLLFFLFIRACGMFFLFGFANMTDMFDVTNSGLRFFDWEFFLPVGLLVQIFGGDAEAFRSVGFFLYWIAVAIALFAVSAVTYCRRKSESATKSAPNRFMQNLYRIGVTFPFLMMGVYLAVVESDLYLFMLCAFVAFLVWVIFELMTTKKIKNVIRSLPLLVIPAVMAAGYGASIVLARNVFYASVPEREDIVSARINFADGTVGSLDDAILSRLDIEDSDVLDRVAEAIEQTVEARDWDWGERHEHGYTYSERFTLTLRSGRKVTYRLRTNIDLYEIFIASKAFQEHNFTMYEGGLESVSGLKLTDAQHLDVWEALKQDYYAMDVSTRVEYMHLNGYYDDSALILTIYGNYQGQRFYQRYMLHPKYTPTAMSLCMQYYGSNDVIGRMQYVKDQILALEKKSVSYATLQVESLAYGNDFSLTCHNFNRIRLFINYLTVDSHLTDFENTENVYRLYISVDSWQLAEKDMAEVEPKATAPYDHFSEEIYLTLSEEDIQRLREFVGYPTEPISEN